MQESLIYSHEPATFDCKPVLPRLDVDLLTCNVFLVVMHKYNNISHATTMYIAFKVLLLFVCYRLFLTYCDLLHLDVVIC